MSDDLSIPKLMRLPAPERDEALCDARLSHLRLESYQEPQSASPQSASPSAQSQRVPVRNASVCEAALREWEARLAAEQLRLARWERSLHAETTRVAEAAREAGRVDEEAQALIGSARRRYRAAARVYRMCRVWGPITAVLLFLAGLMWSWLLGGPR